MNRQCYQLIFNRARGALMAVGEDARATGQGGSGQRRARRAGTTATTMAALLLGGWALHPLAWAQIVADPTAPGNQQATVLSAPNGVPLVNIQTPSAAGVSRNTYSQFDVKSQGVILNNSRGDVQTQLGGWVQGNPWLASGGSARVILNEVNSSKPSSLNGWLEVAGQRAEVVIANPAGIQVNGAGFINAGGVTLTTGTPVFNGGTLEAYRVQGGRISFGGNGLDARGTDYTAILARAVDVNAGIWADRLHVITGANKVQAATLEATPLAASTGEVAPAFALDVSQLGGMYAGQIHLIGTEAGVGVNQRGVVAATAGNLTLQTNGWLTNAGSLQANGHQIAVQAQGVTNTSSGVVAATGLGIRAEADLINQGLIDGAAVDVQSRTLNNQGRLQARDALDLAITETVTNSGVLQSGGELSLTAATILNTSNAVIAANQLMVRAEASLDNQGLVDGVSVDVQSQTLNNQGKVQARDTLDLTVTESVTNSGVLQSEGGLSLTAADIGNTATGVVTADGQAQVSASGSLVNQGLIQADTLGVTVQGQLRNSGRVLADGALALQALSLDNQAAGIVAAANAQLNIGEALENRGVLDGGQVRIQAASVLNTQQGRIYGDVLGIAAGDGLINESSSVIAARERLDIGAQQINNRSDALLFSGADGLFIGGGLDAAGRAQGEAKLLHNDGATIESLGAMTLTVGELRNTNADLRWEIRDGATSSHRELFTVGGTLKDGEIGWTTKKYYIVPANSIYGNPVYEKYYDGPDPVSGGYYETDTSSDNSATYWVDESFVYGPNDPIWGHMGVKAPTWSAPGPKSQAGKLAWDSETNGYYYSEPTPSEIAAWQAKAAPWIALNKAVQDMRAIVVTQDLEYRSYRTYTETAQTVTVTQSKAGQILSGGNMTIRASVSALNQDSSILAGGSLSITGKELTNQATQVQLLDRRSGDFVSYGVTGRECDISGCWNEHGWKDPVDYNESIPRTVALTVVRSGQGVATSSAGSGLTLPPATSAKGPAAALAPLTALSNSALFQPAKPNSGYLVETDPRFANQREWRSSDYLLTALQADPATTQKRLGDGFYEQRLVREQVAQLTGQRFLGDYSDDEAQYQALMESGVTFAQAHKLVPGVTLTAEQVASLTSDIVWLVERTVTLPDGSTTLALVPQVYLAPKKGDLGEDGLLFGGSSTSVIAGRKVIIDVEQDLLNTGSIAGRQVVQISAEGINNLGGDITGGAVFLEAEEDIRNIGGSIGAQTALSLKAGGDIEIASTTTESHSESKVGKSGSASFGGQYVDRVAALYVSKPDGVLVASAGNDINLVGAVLQSAGDIGLNAGNDINLETLQTGSYSDVYYDKKTKSTTKVNPETGETTTRKAPAGSEVLSTENGQMTYSRNYSRTSETQEVGSQINASGNIVLNAGNDIFSRAASVQAGMGEGEGVLIASAGNDITIEAGEATYSNKVGSYGTASNALSSSSSTRMSSSSYTSAQASDWGGDVVDISADGDITVAGSNVVGDFGVSLDAGENINILAVETESAQSSYRKDTKSGFGMGNMAITLGGSQSQSMEQRGTQTHAAGSTVGAIAGNVELSAGKSYTQIGSDLTAGTKVTEVDGEKVTSDGNITVNAERVQIVEARETSESWTQQKTSQSGLSLGVSSPLLSAFQSMSNTAQTMQSTDSERMQALGAATMAMQAYQAGNTAQKLADAANEGDGNAMGVSFSLSVGSSSSTSTTETKADGSRGSELVAGGAIKLNATGAGQDSDILIQGSSIKAETKVSLNAEGDIALLAARNDREQSTTQSSSNASLGIGYTMGAKGNGFGVMGSFGTSQMNGDGSETAYTNTQIKAGQLLEINSGGDTSLIGAVAQAHQITAKVGGDLTIESLQNQATYEEDGYSAGGSFFVGYGGNSASVNYGQTTIDSYYQSVEQQSGLRAGDGGFQVNVKGNTELIGGAITSTDKAVDGGKNSFKTASLTLRDLENKASYSAESIGVSVGTGSGSAGYGYDSGNDSSTTSAGISGIAGNQNARTGDKETGIDNNFDLADVQAELGAQVAITQAFGQNASKLVGDYAEKQLKQADQLEQQANNESDPVRRAQLLAEADQLKSDWGPQGTLRVLAHTTIGALTGGASGATGAALGTLTAPAVADALSDAGIDGPLASILIGAASTAVGAASGGAAGGVTAYNEVTNNYLMHEERQKLKNAEKACYIEKSPEACSTASALRYKDELSDKLLANAAATCEGEDCNKVSQFIQAQMSELGCTAPYACPDYNTLEKYWRVAQEKAQGLVPVYPESWLLDAKAILDLGKLGVRAISGAASNGAESLAALASLSRTDAQTMVNSFYRDGMEPVNWTVGKPGESALNLATHWEKHKLEFPSLQSSNEYYRAAQEFIANPPAGTLTKIIDGSGDVLFYNPTTNIFAVRTVDGLPRTMFRPNPASHRFNSNMDFWNSK
ncbi:filamentous hemagglutinin N-terminal domain-containing protein [Hylemonella gracilis]|uniref:Filamentous hemagglutinin N-terminal domain-containing protein n=1 Tax=Hylemonella gracilis TaxID=80880 RepID=A0A4P6ULA5_9BURK|nr:hemagglutinin repeat-containing protein [Hylemonella gracilis]QBK05304.1 filamentous hemagglutinin N-terminal domain-containing protein [Hylemonella gracilis]